MSKPGGYKLIHEHCARQARLGGLVRHGGKARGRFDSICSLCWRPGPLAVVGPVSIGRLAKLAARKRAA